LVAPCKRKNLYEEDVIQSTIIRGTRVGRLGEEGNCQQEKEAMPTTFLGRKSCWEDYRWGLSKKAGGLFENSVIAKSP